MGTMSHDKIRDAARERMARTGEPYSAARRAVMAEQENGGPGWFEISYSRAGLDKMTAWADAVLFRVGLGVSGVEVDASEIRVRMGSFKLDIPRASVRSARRSQENDPPVHAERGIDSPSRRARVDVLTVSLVDTR